MLIDAGSAASVLSLNEQRKIKNILITHCHLDHVLGLASLADNLYGNGFTIHVWGIRPVISGLKASLFNNTLWPDFTRITGEDQTRPILSFGALREKEPAAVGDSVVTAVRVDHSIPSTGFFITNRGKTLLHIGDTGPTAQIWSLARRKKNLCAVVLETSYPNRLQELATKSGHHTPQSLAEEAGKLGRPSTPFLATHLKPIYREEIIRDLKKIKGQRLMVLKDGDFLRL